MFENVFTQSFFCSAAEANAEQELSLPILATKIIDIATAHANILGIGNPSMQHLQAGWILSRMTIEMTRYPSVNEDYSISTWVEDWNRHFSIRDFSINDADGNPIGYARSVWMILRTTDRTNVGLAHLSLPAGLQIGNPVPITPQTKHYRILPPGTEIPEQSRELVANHPAFRYTFQYTDIDFYRHVNTVRYIVLLLNRFSLEDFDSTFPSRFELSFLHEAVYHQKVDILRYDQPNDHLSSSFSIVDASENTPLLFARFIRSPRTS
ncbi:MAG: thioesterase [Prevotella sp.]|nr:thioesterase [Bacteroides sp.]MCM1366104.1 thioesterase [Prevotella sp.]MCM1436589.1 thioesterase [Prevotella sp.]